MISFSWTSGSNEGELKNVMKASGSINSRTPAESGSQVECSARKVSSTGIGLSSMKWLIMSLKHLAYFSSPVSAYALDRRLT
ncbi:hypothetical protein D3C81_1862170 [compost metagenome]